MRLFAAINFSHEIKSSMARDISELKAASEKGSFTRAENLHLTLAFLGEVPEHRLRAAVNAMNGICAPSFELTVEGFGGFAGEDGSTYWRGLRKSDELTSLRRSLYRGFVFEGFSPDPKPFKPHITLARRCILARPSCGITFEPVSMTVSAVSLMRSDRPSGRLTYTELFRKELKK